MRYEHHHHGAQDHCHDNGGFRIERPLLITLAYSRPCLPPPSVRRCPNSTTAGFSYIGLIWWAVLLGLVIGGLMPGPGRAGHGRHPSVLYADGDIDRGG